MFRSVFPDLHINVEDQIQENDKVVTRFTIRGTQKGDLMQIPATGRKMKITRISIIRFEHGRAVE
jgi:predicted ester cyclase